MNLMKRNFNVQARPLSRVEMAIARYQLYRARGTLDDYLEQTPEIAESHSRSQSSPAKPHLKWYPLNRIDETPTSTTNTSVTAVPATRPSRRYSERVENARARLMISRYQQRKTGGSGSDGKFDESKHRRAPAGQPNGGQFVSSEFSTPVAQRLVISGHSEWNHKGAAGLHVPGLNHARSEKLLDILERGSALRGALQRNAARQVAVDSKINRDTLIQFSTPLSLLPPFRKWSKENRRAMEELVRERKQLQDQWSQLQSEFEQAGFHKQTITGYGEGVDNRGRQKKWARPGFREAVQAYDKVQAPLDGGAGWRQLHGDSSEGSRFQPSSAMTSDGEKVLDVQHRIVERQQSIDKLTRQARAAAIARKSILGNGVINQRSLRPDERDRIEKLEGVITHCNNLIKQFTSDINRDRSKLTKGQLPPNLPRLKDGGPRAVEGGTPNRAVLDDAKSMAELATASYPDSKLSDKAKAAGWSAVREYHDDLNGFNAVLFRNAKTGEVVLGFAGTDSSGDIIANGKQGVGLSDSQYNHAIALAGALKKQFPNLRVTGHSLGGGLASAAALVNRIGDTVTFNAAGVHPWTVSRHGASPSDAPGLIRSFRVTGEFLSSSQDGHWPLGKSLISPAGSAAADSLSAIMPDGVGTSYWLQSTGIHPGEKHGMSHIQEGLNRITPAK